MSFEGYLELRETFIHLGQFLHYSLGIMGAIVMLTTIYCVVAWKQEKLQYKRIDSFLSISRYMLVGIFIAGFISLIWFHAGIARELALVNPVDGRVIASYKIPLWIENEKLFFWGFTFSLFSLGIRNRDVFQTTLVNITLALFAIITFLFSSPFLDPLPIFHKEMVLWNTWMNSDIAPQLFMSMYGKLVYFYNSSYMWLHPPLLFISYSALTLTLVGSIGMLSRRNRVDNDLFYQFSKIGYLFLSLGLILGYPWALEAWGRGWWWDPKITGSLITWSLYTALLHSNLYAKRSLYRLTGGIGVICFISLLLTYLLTYFGSGVHAYG